MNRCTLGLILAIVAIAGGTSANAQLAGELGLLDLTANDGINPATDAPWQAGDTYRFCFTSSETTQATSNDINYYNTFVQNLANTSPLNIGAAQGVTWKVIGSTADILDGEVVVSEGGAQETTPRPIST